MQTWNKLHPEKAVVENYNRLKNTLFRSSEGRVKDKHFSVILKSPCSFKKAERPQEIKNRKIHSGHLLIGQEYTSKNL